MANKRLSFTIGTLAGFPLATEGVNDAFLAIAHQPVPPPSAASQGYLALLLAGIVGLLLARFAPGFFVAIETGKIDVDAPPEPDDAVTVTTKTTTEVGNVAPARQ